MSISYFSTDTAFNVENPGELFEALDTLHTQVLDNFPGKIAAPYLDVLEKAMERMDELLSFGKP